MSRTNFGFRKDPGFVLRGRAIRQALDAVVTRRREASPGNYISREMVARELLADAIERETGRPGKYRE